MLLTRRNNACAPNTARNPEIDRVFNDLFASFPVFMPFAASQRTDAFPPLNIWEDDHSLFLEAELPGMRLEDVEVLVMGDELTLRGTRSAQAEEQGSNFIRRERIEGEFTRTVRLPVEIDAERVQATLENGVLSVTLPKAEAAKPRKIRVTNGRSK